MVLLLRDEKYQYKKDCKNTVLKTEQFNKSETIEQDRANLSYGITTFIVSYAFRLTINADFVRE